MQDFFKRMKQMRDEMDRMFNQFSEIPEIEFKQPLSDIQETKDKIIVNLDLPGIDKKDIQLIIKDDILEVKAEKKQETRISKKDYYKQERSYSGFHRVLTLPSSVEAEKAKADYKNGVLTITIPKSKKQIKKGRKIQIK